MYIYTICNIIHVFSISAFLTIYIYIYSISFKTFLLRNYKFVSLWALNQLYLVVRKTNFLPGRSAGN